MCYPLTFIKNHNIFADIENISDEFLNKVKEEKLINDNLIIKNLTSLFTKKKTCYNCGAGKGFVSISISGKVYPCHRFVGNDDYNIGDVYKIDNKNRKLFNTPQTKKSKECIECWAKYMCGGNCYQENLEMRSSVFLPYKPSCDLMKKNIETAIYIYDNMDKNDRAFFREKLK